MTHSSSKPDGHRPGLDTRFERDVIPTPKPTVVKRLGRFLGILMAIIGFVGGAGLVMGAVIAQFDVKSMIRPESRPAVYSSFDDGPLELEAGSYAATSLRSKLTSCSVRSIYGGATLHLTTDPAFTDRTVYRFDIGKGTYTVRCTPSDAWFEVYRGQDVEIAVKGYEGNIHPSIYLAAAAVPFLLVGAFFWSRFVKRPRDWDA